MNAHIDVPCETALERFLTPKEKTFAPSNALRKLKFPWFVTRSGNYQNWHFCVARNTALDG